MQSCETGAEHSQSFCGETVGLSSFVRWQRLDQPFALKACNRTVECPGTESRSAHAKNVFDHGVAVLGAIGQARHYQQWRVGISPDFGRIIYVMRTSYHVVLYNRNSGRMQQLSVARGFTSAKPTIGRIQAR